MEKGPTIDEYEGVNIGDNHSLKMNNIRKWRLPKEKEASKQIFIEYQDVFTWIYEDLKKL